jgi:nucleoside-diphosphate-sugar epimerase
MSGAGKTILITGGSGYVAAEVINAFLTRGYNVRTTIRNESGAEKIKKAHEKYASQLSFAIVKDIQIPGGHDEAVKGVDGVRHLQLSLASHMLIYFRSSIQHLLSSFKLKIQSVIYSSRHSMVPWRSWALCTSMLLTLSALLLPLPSHPLSISPRVLALDMSIPRRTGTQPLGK